MICVKTTKTTTRLTILLCRFSIAICHNPSKTTIFIFTWAWLHVSV